MGRVERKVALVTGAARGQGRAIAVRLAEEGADIIAIDICAPIATVPYSAATPEDLDETAAQVASLGRSIVARIADVRDAAGLRQAVGDGVKELGPLDVVCANAGIWSSGSLEQMTDETWDDVIAVNLRGVWNTLRAAAAHLRDGGSIVLTSSTLGLTGAANTAHYGASKHGIVGIMRGLAHELAPRMIRVNTVHPTAVATPMIHNEAIYRLYRPDLEHPTRDDFAEPATLMNLLPVPEVEPRDVANAVLFLASDEARYITGATLPVDAGALTK
jgi:SDR family mycofactocin-dependent oxidoreductase